mgnify:CR=1 FL=1
MAYVYNKVSGGTLTVGTLSATVQTAMDAVAKELVAAKGRSIVMGGGNSGAGEVWRGKIMAVRATEAVTPLMPSPAVKISTVTLPLPAISYDAAVALLLCSLETFFFTVRGEGVRILLQYCLSKSQQKFSTKTLKGDATISI